MKNFTIIKIFFFSILLYSKSYSQNSGELVYTSINKLNNYLEEKYILSFNDNLSLFTLKEREVSSKIKTDETETEITISNKYPDSLAPKYFINSINNEILYSKPISNDDFKTFKNYNINEKLILDWVIQDDSIIISNIKCQKATLNFRGRNYTAWFSTEHNIPFGPFKFYGLPGLIIQIQDDRKEVFFSLNSINLKQTDVKKNFDKFNKNVFIDLIKFNNIQNKATIDSQDEFQRNLQSKLGRGATIKVVKTQNFNIELNFDDLLVVKK
jgi:GLPGLI family protein